MKPDRPEPRHVYAEVEDLSEGEWVKAHERRMTQEPVRPDGVTSDWRWDRTFKDENGDWDGGYWVEQPAAVNARYAKILAKREGFCGLAGKPAAGCVR